MNRSLVWFKTDLRLHDNETLVRAIEQSDEIIPVYCFDDNHFKTTPYGFQKTGNFRAKFLLESLADLEYNLKKAGSGLIITKGNPAKAIIELVNKYGAQKVFATKETAPEEIQTQQLVEKELNKIHCRLETFETSTLYHPQDLPFAPNEIPDVFTAFRKRVEKESFVRTLFQAPEQIRSPHLELFILPDLNQLGLFPCAVDSRAAITFKGGETEAIKRVHEYLFKTKAISTYKETRNGMTGKNYSSKFSAWLAIGCLSPKFIYHEIKKYEAAYAANESTYWLVFELLWRDYFRIIMEKYPHQFFLRNGIKKGPTNKTIHDQSAFLKWQNGETESDFVNANMLELKHTGFMSNRGRQNVASYLCHEMNLDWRYGAAYFEQQLIDYDVCSNWGNWAYVAGVGTDPRSRVFNVNKQAEDYDKDRRFRNLWLNNG